MAAVFKEFDYRPHRLKTLAVFLFYCGVTALVGCTWMFVKGGVVLNGIPLTETQFRRFQLTLAFLFLPVPAYTGALIFVAFFRDRRIALTLNTIILPKQSGLGLSSEEIEISFAEIASVAVWDINRWTKALRIEHRRGVVYIFSNMFHDIQIFQHVAAFVQAGFEECRRK